MIFVCDQISAHELIQSFQARTAGQAAVGRELTCGRIPVEVDRPLIGSWLCNHFVVYAEKQVPELGVPRL